MGIADQKPPTVYQMIKMDPPWPETGGGGRGAQNHYPVIKTRAEVLDVIMGSGVFRPHINCHLILWYTNNYLLWATWLMEKLGFTYKTQVTWPKVSPGTGYYFPGQTEHFLFGVKGTLAPRVKFGGGSTLMKVADDPSQYSDSHSKKPPEIYDIAEKVGYGPRLEMFARGPRPRWDSWGRDDMITMEIERARDNGQDVQGLVTPDHKMLDVGCVVRTSANGLTEIARTA